MVSPLTPELAQPSSTSNRSKADLGREGGTPLLQQPMGLVNRSPAPHSNHRLQGKRIALQIAGFGDRLPEPGGGDQLPGLVAGRILLKPEGIALLFAITAQALGSPLGRAAELLAMKSIERGIENRALFKAEGVDAAQVFCLGLLTFF